jgi:HEPN domain-containing protein
MNEPVDLARGWMAKADSDLASAILIVDSPGPYDTACFHAQQAAEKFLKGLLAFYGQPFPHTHNLEELERRCIDLDPAPDFGELDLTLLTPYAVQLRYDPGFWPDQATAYEAVTLAQKVRIAVLAVLPSEAHPPHPPAAGE